MMQIPSKTAHAEMRNQYSRGVMAMVDPSATPAALALLALLALLAAVLMAAAMTR